MIASLRRFHTAARSAPTGTGSAAFLTGEQWGDWNGNLMVGIMGIGFGGTPSVIRTVHSPGA